MYKDGAFAVATPLGEPLSAFEYYNPQPFNEYGIAICENNNGKSFFVDTRGKQLNELPGYEGIILAEGGLYIIKEEYDYYVVSPQNPKPVFQAKYSLPNKLEEIGKDLQIPEWAQFIEKISTFEYAENFAEGIALVLKGGKWGYWTKAGRFLFEPQFEAAENFAEGIAGVQKGGKWGYVTKAGRFLFELQFEGAGSFAEGIALVKKDGKWGYVTKAGRFLFEPQFEAADNFSEGIARVQKGDKWGYVSQEGRFLFEPQFEGAGNFAEGIAGVQKGGKWGYVTKAGRFLFEPQFEGTPKTLSRASP